MKLNVRVSLVARGVSFAGVDLVAMAFGHLQKQGSLMVADELQRRLAEPRIEEEIRSRVYGRRRVRSVVMILRKSTTSLALLVVLRCDVQFATVGFFRALHGVAPQSRELRAEVARREMGAVPV